MIDFLMKLNPIILAFIACMFTYFFTFLGAGVVLFFKNVNKTIMDGSLSFASGIMISASFWSLINPGIELANQLGQISFLIAAAGFLTGGLFLLVGDKICTSIMDKTKKSKSGKLKRTLLLIVSITIHNIPEGLAVGVAFGALSNNMNYTSFMNAIMLALGIAIQNFPEGSAVSLPLRREGYSRGKSFFYGQLSAVVEPLAALIGALLVRNIVVIMPFLLCFAAGAMIYVVVRELVPESQTNEKKNLMAIFTLIGFSVMMILDVALG